MKIYKVAESTFDPAMSKSTGGEISGTPETSKKELDFGSKGHTSTSEVLQAISSALPEKISSWYVGDGTVGWYKFKDGIVYEVLVTPAARGRYFNTLKNELEHKEEMPHFSGVESSNKIIKTSEDSMTTLSKIVDFVLRKVSESRKGAYNYAPNGRILNGSVEFSDEAMGTAYYQIMFSQNKNAFSIERYYENENLNNEYAMTKYVPMDMENPQASVDAIQSVIDNMLKS